MLQIRFADDADREAVRHFLALEGYTGGVGPDDRMVVAEQDGVLVGAFRLVEEHGCLVLRGMRVRDDLRRGGIGGRMLGLLSGLERRCFCVPYRHLAGFYGRAGFEVLPSERAPDFLAARAREYRERELDVIVMERPVSAGGSP